MTRTKFQHSSNQLENILRNIMIPLARVLARAGITPNQISVTGCLLSLVAAAILLNGELLVAGVLFLFASALDMLDGHLARAQEQESRAGALLDSVLDRVSEGAIFTAITIHFFATESLIGVCLTLTGWIGAYLTSYIRARAHSLGTDIRGGLVKRPQRVVIIALGLVSHLLVWAMLLLAVTTVATAAYRAVVAVRRLRDLEPNPLEADAEPTPSTPSEEDERHHLEEVTEI